MTVEIATFVAGLDENQPPSGDPKSQGDDHLRLIKKVLKNTFPNATGPITGRQKVVVKTTSETFTVLATQENTLFVLNVPDTVGSQINAHLPAGLVAADAGWECSFIKGSLNANAYYLLAPNQPTGRLMSGELGSLQYARRAIPGHLVRAVWTGTTFMAERAPRVPVGTILDHCGTALPFGYEWANGQTLPPITYLDYSMINSAGVTPDMRGRVGAGRDDMGAPGLANANRIGTVGTLVGITLGSGGGINLHTLTAGEMPIHNHPVYIRDPQHRHAPGEGSESVMSGPPNNNPNLGAAGSNNSTMEAVTAFALTGVRTNDAPGGAGVDDRTANAGGGAAHTNMQPTLILNKIVVVE